MAAPDGRAVVLKQALIPLRVMCVCIASKSIWAEEIIGVGSQVRGRLLKTHKVDLVPPTMGRRRKIVW